MTANTRPQCTQYVYSGPDLYSSECMEAFKWTRSLCIPSIPSRAPQHFPNTCSDHRILSQLLRLTKLNAVPRRPSHPHIFPSASLVYVPSRHHVHSCCHCFYLSLAYFLHLINVDVSLFVSQTSSTAFFFFLVQSVLSQPVFNLTLYFRPIFVWTKKRSWCDLTLPNR